VVVAACRTPFGHLEPMAVLRLNVAGIFHLARKIPQLA